MVMVLQIICTSIAILVIIFVLCVLVLLISYIFNEVMEYLLLSRHLSITIICGVVESKSLAFAKIIEMKRDKLKKEIQLKLEVYDGTYDVSLKDNYNSYPNFDIGKVIVVERLQVKDDIEYKLQGSICKKCLEGEF